MSRVIMHLQNQFFYLDLKVEPKAIFVTLKFLFCFINSPQQLKKPLEYTYLNVPFVFVSAKEKLVLNIALACELHFWGENSVPSI